MGSSIATEVANSQYPQCKEKFMPQQSRAGLEVKLGKIAKRKLGIAEKTLKDVEDELSFFDITWENLLNNHDVEIAESAQNDFSCLILDTRGKQTIHEVQ
ncbi:hypothetical protein EB796_015291 [Bugula neritina]|uniref:Uncharacterized protein n=1 Tax=Bugula neritina TaxID=10212 RepID=A0A7J7JKP1_BUGNE|nr:hypothetical protein EB796_015291 [Bugula neritina]